MWSMGMFVVVVRALMTGHLLHLSPAGRGRAEGAGEGARADRDSLAPSPHPSPQRGEGACRVRGTAEILPAPTKPVPRPASHLLHPPPPRGERSDSERSEGIRVGGRFRESEPAEKPPHPTCFAPQALRSQVDPGSSPGQALSPQAGRGGASGESRADTQARSYP